MLFSVKPHKRVLPELVELVPRTAACPSASKTLADAEHSADMQEFFASKPYAVHTADGNYIHTLQTACLYALMHVPNEAIRRQLAATCGIHKDTYEASYAMFLSAPEAAEDKKNAIIALFNVWRLTPYNTQRPGKDTTFKLDYQWCPSDTWPEPDSTSLFAIFQQELVQRVMRLHPSSDVGGRLKHDSVLLYYCCVCGLDYLGDSHFDYLRAKDVAVSFLDDHDGKTIILHEVENVIAERDPHLADEDNTDAAHNKLVMRTGDSLEGLFRRMCFKAGVPDLVLAPAAAVTVPDDTAAAAAEDAGTTVTDDSDTAQGVGDTGGQDIDTDTGELVAATGSAISSDALCHYHHYGDTTVPLCSGACLESKYGASAVTERTKQVGAALIGRDRLKRTFGVAATPAHVPKNIKEWIGLANAVHAPTTAPLGHLEGIDDLARGTSWQGADAGTKTRNYILAMSGHPLDAIWRENGWGAPAKADEDRVRAYRATNKVPSLRTAQLLMHFAGQQ
jgi:hypothetical protein